MTVSFMRYVVALLYCVLTVSATTVAHGDTRPIPVPKNIIYAGQQISSNLLRDRVVPVKYLNRVSVIKDYSEIVGKVAKVTLVPNRPIPSNTIAEPYVVKVNVRTTLLFNRGALRITAEVMPMNAAREGELVRARNLQTGVIVYGTAQRDGTIVAGGRG